jgi:2-hydroxychromene-2-carboxylate isomerase
MRSSQPGSTADRREIVAVEASPRVEFFFSPGSRYSYLAASRMALLEAETGCTVDWRPVNGGDIRKLRHRDPFEGEPVSGQYDWSYRERDARLWADFYGIRFREPPSHHFDFWLLARAATAAKRLGRAADYGWRICAAVYGTDTWPIDETICIALAEEIGLAADLFWATLEDPRNRASPCRGRGRGFSSGRVWSADVLCRCADVLGQRPAHDPQACSQEAALAVGAGARSLVKRTSLRHAEMSAYDPKRT